MTACTHATTPLLETLQKTEAEPGQRVCRWQLVCFSKQVRRLCRSRRFLQLPHGRDSSVPATLLLLPLPLST